ncbi:MAG: type IV toxin-antitoxin system AbiEi family antitoxin domain-containing protein [Prevotellaceae bacterium]|nr:type IV toxin-antitoxin system AbiEi family antitoxin domain-containing protein [Candidatus Faecinaster equi]
MDRYIELIKQIINNLPHGSAFVVSDFTNICDYQTAKRTLARFVDSGDIRRVIRGVYDKPSYSNLLKEYVAPDPNQVAMAIARNFNWTIVPAGNAALNLLGLSTQVPARWEFSSSGPYRNYEVGNITLCFKHSSNKEIEGLSYDTALLVQAIKALGKENITDDAIIRLRNRTDCLDKDVVLQEARYTTSWIFAVIKKICEKDME